jgi:hypothetical protein
MSEKSMPMAEALKQLKEEFGTKAVEVSIEQNYAAYRLCGEEMETFVRVVLIEPVMC